MSAEPTIWRCLAARRAQLVQRAELLGVSDAPAEGIEVALEALSDEMEFLLSLYRESKQALELDAIAKRWSLK